MTNSVTTKPDSLSDGEGGHTPGPWIHETEDAWGTVWADKPVARVIGDSAEAEANARLIASAPDLLEALKGIIDDAGSAFIYSRLIHGNVDDEDALKALQNDMAARINKARAAIAKAEAPPPNLEGK
jgi:hypothetical protein